MGECIGLNVSLKDTAICVRRDGKRVWRGKCASDPAVIAGVLRKHAADAQRIVFETGPELDFGQFDGRLRGGVTKRT